MERRHVDRSLQHVYDALEQEGKILTPTDKELLYQNDRERMASMDNLTIKEARETVGRLGREFSRLRAVEGAITAARNHLKRTVGKDDDGDDL